MILVIVLATCQWLSALCCSINLNLNLKHETKVRGYRTYVDRMFRLPYAATRISISDIFKILQLRFDYKLQLLPVKRLCDEARRRTGHESNRCARVD